MESSMGHHEHYGTNGQNGRCATRGNGGHGNNGHCGKGTNGLGRVEADHQVVTWAPGQSGMWADDDVDPDAELTPERIQEILHERARVLARSAELESSEMRQIVVFSLADESYGIPTDCVKEVQSLTNLSPVPCTPVFVVGVINVRGAIYSVIDIRKFFGLADRQRTDRTKVILVYAGDLGIVGILADDVKGATNVPTDAIRNSLATQTGVKEEYIEGVTQDMLIILNLDAVFSDERIVVDEEIV